MPIKNFFSGRKPEENNVAPVFSADEGMFEADFDGMQSLDMYADEDSAAGGFAALLQPDNAFSAQETEEMYYDDDLPFDEGGDGQNVGEAVFQNLFAEDAKGGEDDFFVAQQDDFPQSGDDFFAAQSEDYVDEATQNDVFFAAQPMEFEQANAQHTDDFFAAQQIEQTFVDAAHGALPTQENTVQVLSDTSLQQAAPLLGSETSVRQPTVELDAGIPFDIAVPEQTQSFAAEQEIFDTESFNTEYVQKRKYAPVFTQPIPSALDELRAGIVKPASPISSIAATQIPLVVTAAEAAAAEVTAKVAAETVAAKAAAEEQTARNAAERATVEAQAAQFGYQDPTPNEMGFGYVPVAHDSTRGYDNAPNGSLSAEEFQLPVTADAPVWHEGAHTGEGTDFLAMQEQGDFSASVPAGERAFVSEQESQHPAFFDYDNAPVESNAAYENVDTIDFSVTSAAQDNSDVRGSMQEENFSAETPGDYAHNLQSMFSNDDTYAAVDAIEQPYHADAFDAQGVENIDYGTFEDDGFGDPVFEEADFNGNAFAEDAFSDTDFGAAHEDEVATGEFDLTDDDYADFDLEDDNAQGSDSLAANPFESEEWLAEENYEDDSFHNDGHRFHNDKDRPLKTKQKKSGGSGGGTKSNLPLIIMLVGLVLAILGVVAFLLLNKEKTPAQISSIPSSLATPQISSVAVSEVPSVDPIPRDEWYMKLANRQNVLTADFKVETTNCSDGIPVDTRMVDALNQMISDGKATGLKLIVKSGYRTYDRQKTNYDYQVAQQIAAGKSKADAETAAAIITAPPGASEHNLGLAVDIMSVSFTDYDAKYDETAEAKWLLENAANYGFILRYSKTSQSITGFEYEPWHYRYVGIDQAKKVKDSGLALEEYLSQDAPTGIPTAGGADSVSAVAGADDANAAQSTEGASSSSSTSSSSAAQ